MYTRPYNAASTAAAPSRIEIQIGKGLKGRTVDLFKSAAKVTAGQLNSIVYSTSTDYGAQISTYDNITGVLALDTGRVWNTTTTVHELLFTDATTQTSGYVVINASKNPALTGLNISAVAARGVNTAGTSITNAGEVTLTYDAAKTYDTHGALNTSTGVFTAPESGYYMVSASVGFPNATYAAANQLYLTIYKNGSAYSSPFVQKVETASTSSWFFGGSTGVFLVKNETLKVNISNSRTAGATTLTTSADANQFTIHKTSIG